MSYVTIALDDDWDLTLDGQGFVAINTGAQAVAQDAASASMTFLNEVYYDSTLGIPYDTKVFGRPASLTYLSAKMKTEVKKLAVVDDAECTLSLNRATRKVSGNMLITYNETETVQVSL